MADFAVSAAIGCVFAVLATMLVLGSYFAARRILGRTHRDDRMHEAAATVAVRIAALHGLILALVYAQEMGDFKDVRTMLASEAVAVADVYNDVRRYGGPDVVPVQTGLARYVATVAGEEWRGLGRGEGLSGVAWTQWDAVYGRLLDLAPTTERQHALANRMRGRITDIASYRQTRGSMADSGFSGLFWAPALIGLALLAVPFAVYPPTRNHLILLGIFGLYSGVILFFIYAFSNPFAPPGLLHPTALQDLLDGDLGRSLVPPEAAAPS